MASKKQPLLILDDTMDFDGKSLPVKIYLEDRKNAMGSIRKTGIRIHIPAFLDEKKRREHIDLLKNKLTEKLRKKPAVLNPKTYVEHKDGDVLLVGDKEYRLRIGYKEANRSTARITGDTICLTLSSKIPNMAQNKHASELISKCIAGKRLPDIQRKILHLNAEYFNQKINKISFRHSKTRWGSCSSRGNITISTKLLFAPDDVIEYVCIHELAHLIEQNHSERFWALVKKAIPDYKEKLKWLKQNGDKCIY